MYFLDFKDTIFDPRARAPYADAPEVLRALGNEAVIVTRDPEPFVRESLKEVVRLTVLSVGGASKASYLKTWPGYTGAPAVFADDSPSELAELAEAFPAMKLFEVRRDGGTGDGRFPVIRTLAELP